MRLFGSTRRLNSYALRCGFIFSKQSVRRGHYRRGGAENFPKEVFRAAPILEKDVQDAS